MNRITIALGLAIALVAGPSLFADDKAKSNESGAPADLIGAYTIVSGEKYGQPEPPERIEGVTVRFAEDAIVVLDKEKKEVYAQTYKIDTSSKPWKIKLRSKITPKAEGSAEEITEGLIEKSGDTVKLIYAVPGGETPTEFKTKEKQLLFVMKNMNKKGD